MDDSWVLHGQFVFAAKPFVFNREGFRAVRLDALYGFVHESLDCVTVKTGNGWEISFFGYVARMGVRLADGAKFNDPEPLRLADIRAFVRDYSGRYIAVVANEDRSRQWLFTDAFASLPVVYDVHAKTFGSTTTILREDLRYATLDSILSGAKGSLDAFDYSSEFLPVGLTTVPTVRRLLPNHYLDLQDFSPVRYWPQQPPSTDADDMELAREAAEAVRRNVAALPSEQPLVTGLTAGRDSRVLLAAILAQRQVPNCQTFTFDYRNRTYGNAVDLHIGKRLAAAHSLPWRRLDASEVENRFRLLYKFNTGGCVSTNKAGDFLQASAIFGADISWLTGFGGEVAKQADTIASLTAAELTSRHLPRKPVYVDSVKRWKNALPSWLDPTALVELFYIENRLACWASAHTYGTAPFKQHIIPFCDVGYVDACFQMSLEFRKCRDSQLAMIRHLKKDLLGTPFETFTGIRRWAWRIRESRYGRVFKHLPLCLESLWQ